MRVSEIRVKQIRVNQELGVTDFIQNMKQSGQIFKGDFKKNLTLLYSIDCHLMIC